MLDRNETAARLKKISEKLSDSWKDFKLTKKTKNFNPYAGLNPFILKEASIEEGKTFDQSQCKCIYSKQVIFLKSVLVVKCLLRL